MPKLLKLILLAAFFNCLSWIVLVPVWQYSDEQAHFSQVQDMAEIGYVPTASYNTSKEISDTEIIFGTDRTEGNNKYTYHPEYTIDYTKHTQGTYESQISSFPIESRTIFVKSEATTNPPAYYFLSSLVYKSFYNLDIISRVYAVRIFSMILFLLLIYFGFKSAQIIFKDRLLVYTLTALIAFKPMLIFASTGVLPDPLTNLLFSLVLYLSLLIFKNGINRTYLFLILTVVITGLFTRQQFLLSAPIIAVAVIYDSIRRRRNLKIVIFSIVLVVVLTVISNHTSQIPILNSLHIPEFLVFEFGKFIKPEFFGYLNSALQKTYAETWPWYWGVYKWLSFTPPHLTYEVINRIVLVSVIGLLYKIFQSIRKRDFDQQFFIFLFAIVSSAIYFSAFILWDYFFQEHKGYSFGFQGRYFFPMIVFSMAVLLIGFWQFSQIIFKKYAKFALAALVLLMILFNNVSLFTLSATYYSFTDINTFIAQASQYKPLFFKGNVISLLLLTALLGQALVIYQMFRLASKARI